MSEVIPVQHESAVAIMRERVLELDAEIAGYTDSLRLANAQREVVLDMIARLTRVPRTRKPRVVIDSRPANDHAPMDQEEPGSRPTPPPGVFATPSLGTADAA